MNLVLNIPADLEEKIKKRAEQAGMDVPTYVLQTLRVSDLELAGEPHAHRCRRSDPEYS